MLRASPDQSVLLAAMNTEWHPGNWQAWTILGKGLLAQGKKDEAVEAFETAIKQNGSAEAAKQQLHRLKDGASNQRR